MPLAFITFLDGSRMPVDPGFGVDVGAGPGDIDNTLPVPNPPEGEIGNLPTVPPGWPVIPSHPIARPPFGGRIDNSLPVIPNPPPGEIGNLPAVPPGWPVVPTHPWIPPRRPHHGHWPVDPGYGIESGRPDQGLPPAPDVPPGNTLVLVRDPSGKWYYAMVPQGTTKPLPTPTPPIAPPPTAQPKS